LAEILLAIVDVRLYGKIMSLVGTTLFKQFVKQICI